MDNIEIELLNTKRYLDFYIMKYEELNKKLQKKNDIIFMLETYLLENTNIHNYTSAHKKKIKRFRSCRILPLNLMPQMPPQVRLVLD